MDAINIRAAVVPTLPARSQSAPVLSKPAPLPEAPKVEVEVKVQAPQPVRDVSQPIANANVLGNNTFAIYKVNGQLVTRITDSGTGEVTYVPKLEMVELESQATTVTIDV
jgi:hypothetical protein